MLSFAITGCRTIEQRPAFPCDKPELRGDTWADVAILSVEQAAQIDVCNIRNGVDTYKREARATSVDAPRGLDVSIPTPVECGYVGVQVPHDRPATGEIIEMREVPRGTAGLYCGSREYVGCAFQFSGNRWKIIFEPQQWIKTHEICHAVYETTRHTLEYMTSRGDSE
jgi:hypothetical protein